MSDEKLIPNIDYLGRCYDLVDTDPLNLGSSSKSESAIDIDVGESTANHTPDGIYIVPLGVKHRAPFAMSYETRSSVISSSFDFQQEFKNSVEANAEIPGVFEFSGSLSHKEITRQTETRKNSFVYSRAYQENHILTLALENEKAPLKVTEEFSDAVAALPFEDDYEEMRPAYEAFLRRFGTHFAKEIVLGGLAFQRTSGSSKTYLQSREAEDTLKAKASLQLEKVQAGVGAEQARREAAASDTAASLERTALEFRGGTGSPNGIESSWIDSTHTHPAIVKSKMEPLSALLIERFFPKEDFIDEKQFLLNMAI